MTTLELETRRAPFAPASYNPETRTIEAVISTGADVERRDARGPFIERLALATINPADLVNLPVLDGHRQGGSEHVVGVIIAARHEGAALVATIRLSDAEDVRSAVRKVEEGVLRGVSIGYAPTASSESKDAAGRRVKTITPKIREVSLVAIPADEGSQIRSTTMDPEVIDPPVVTPPAVVTRAETNAQIRSIAEIAGLERSWADAQIDADADVAATREAAFTAMQARSGATASIRAHVGADNSDPAIVRNHQAEALAYRMGGPEAPEAARQYLDMGFADLARDALVRSGVNVAGMSRETLISRAMHTTSDFPLLLEQSGTRVVETAYQLAESPLKALARRRLMTDLRSVTLLKAGEVSPLQKVTESGEIKSVTMGEGAEAYTPETYAGILTLSRKLLLNDQFGVFGDAAAKLGQAAAQAEADALVGLLTQASGAGPVMSDGTRLFHVGHGNLGSLELTTDNIGLARVALRSQKGVDGVSPVNVTPKYLVVGPARETGAEMILTNLAAASPADQNLFAGRLTLIVEPRITDGSWYIFGDPATAPVLEIAYLASAPGPQLSSRDGWDVLGREFRVVLDLGVGAVDHRGAYYSAGV